MLPTDCTSATACAASGKRHHLWKPGGRATAAASTDSLSLRSLNEAATAVARSRTTALRGNLVRRPAWTAGLRSIATHRELCKGEKSPATSRTSASQSTCRVFSSRLSKPFWLSLSCRSRLKNSISAPRSREPQQPSLYKASLC